MQRTIDQRPEYANWTNFFTLGVSLCLYAEASKQRQTVRVTFSDEDWLYTEVNGTRLEIFCYYIGSRPQDYDERHPHRTRFPVNVEFIR